jgi:hypothetical protein
MKTTKPDRIAKIQKGHGTSQIPLGLQTKETAPQKLNNPDGRHLRRWPPPKERSYGYFLLSPYFDQPDT